MVPYLRVLHFILNQYRGDNLEDIADAIDIARQFDEIPCESLEAVYIFTRALVKALQHPQDEEAESDEAPEEDAEELEEQEEDAEESEEQIEQT